MDISILALKILSIYLMVSGLFLIFKGKSVPVLLKDFFGHPAIVYLTGIILIFLSTMFLIGHNTWGASWKTIITIFAWLVLIKGVAYIFFPKALNDMMMKKFKGMFRLYGFVAVIIGVYLFFLP